MLELPGSEDDHWYRDDWMGEKAQMEMRGIRCFVLNREIEEIEGGMYVLRRCRLIFDKKLSFPLDARDEVGAVPRSLDELGISLPPDLADRVWERPEIEWGDLKCVQESFGRYERLFTEHCAQMNSQAILCAFEAAEEHAAFLKRSPMGGDDRLYQIYLDNVVRKFREWFGDYHVPLPEEIRGIAISVQASPPAPEQATKLDRFKAECDARGLKRGKMVPREVLFEIAKEVYQEGVPPFEQFKSGDRIYHRARKAASDHGYRKPPRGNALQ